VGSSSNNNSNNRTNNNNPQQNNSPKPKTSDKSATTKKKNRKERNKSSDSSSSSSSDSESEDLIWVDGEKEVEVPKKQLKENGSPCFGWAFCLVSTKKNKAKAVTKSHHLAWVAFLVQRRTVLSWPGPFGHPQNGKEPKRQSVIHKCDLVWIPCTGT